MAVSSVDPTFNGGQPASSGTDAALRQNAAAAVAVQPGDGKIILAGTISTYTSGLLSGSTLAVRRYNADGSLDATFGTGGEADVPLAVPAGNLVTSSSNVLVQPDGKIVLAGRVFQATSAAPAASGTLVVRLDPDGSLDPTFGVGGVASITTDSASLSHLALQGDGKVVLAGSATPTGAAGASLAATRLDAAGAVDPTFNGGNLRELDAATYGGSVVVGVFVAPGGSIVLATAGGVAELTTVGAVDASFGTGGAGFAPNVGGRTNTAAALQPDGKVVLAGTVGASDVSLARLDAAGAVDPTFAPPAAVPLAGLGTRRILRTPESVLVLPDGRIVVGGTFENGFINPSLYGVARFTAAGARDTTFGVAGIASFGINGGVVEALAATANGQVVAAGSNVRSASPGGHGIITSSSFSVARLRDTTLASGSNGDYDGDNISDIAAQFDSGIFTTRNYHLQDTPTPFGATGVGAMIPVSGDFDGDGKADVAGYIVQTGTFAYRPSSGGADVYYAFGSAGAGQSIPSVGDFDGDGKADMAVYLPAYSGFAVHPSDGSANYLVPFGSAGAGNSIPAVADYDDNGRSDFVVYLPAYGGFAVHLAGGDTTIGGFFNFLVPFGPAGAGASIPAPGDYNGDGLADYAVYLPAYGAFAIKPNPIAYANELNYFEPFGLPGAGATIPAPGDYDGDGKTDVAAYIPSLGLFAFRRSMGNGPDALEPFGGGGPGATVPATSIPYAQGATVSGMAVASSGAGVVIPLTDDVLADIAKSKKKPRA